MKYPGYILKTGSWRNNLSAGWYRAGIFVFLIFVNSCITSFDPRIEKYENALVVDGILTNLPGSCYVKLSHTYPYDSRNYITESDASVRIIDGDGNEINMISRGDGNYTPEDSTFAGIVGLNYRIKIETASGEIFESEPEELKEPVDIDEVSYKVVDKGGGIMSVQIFVNTQDPLRKSFYYSWDYDETWEFVVPYQSLSEFLPEMKICYKNNTSRRILIESTKGYTDDRVIDFPLYSVDNTTNRLSVKYSVLVRQYVLTEKTYQLYRNLKDLTENTGTLFDRTPVLTTGNIACTSSPGVTVLGNFQVSGASEKRIFILKDDLPPELSAATEYEYCKAVLYDRNSDSGAIDSLLRLGWVGMDTIPDPDTGRVLIGMVIARSCFDCTTKGSVTRPDFWDYRPFK